MADKQNKDGAAAGAGKPAAPGGKKGEESKKEEVKDVLAAEELVSFQGSLLASIRNTKLTCFCHIE